MSRLKPIRRSIRGGRVPIEKTLIESIEYVDPSTVQGITLGIKEINKGIACNKINCTWIKYLQLLNIFQVTSPPSPISTSLSSTLSIPTLVQEGMRLFRNIYIYLDIFQQPSVLHAIGPLASRGRDALLRDNSTPR